MSPPGEPEPKRKARDTRKRPLEVERYDVLEGPCARLFHGLFGRRWGSARTSGYSFPLAQIERLALMLDVADRNELLYLSLAPFIGLAAYLWRRWLPIGIGGYFELAITVYVGFWFVVLVFLDRRVDQQQTLRSRHTRWIKNTAMRNRLTHRRNMAVTRAEVREQAIEAKARGREKAQQAATAQPATPASPDIGPTLDDLLQ